MPDQNDDVEVTAQLHGKPLEVPMHTREERIRGVESVEVELKFALNMKKFGLGVIPIPDQNVPSRWLATMVTAITKGPEAPAALEAPSKNPQPNDLFGKLLPRSENPKASDSDNT